MANAKYWEVETPVEIKGEKSVVKIYKEAGKIQVFPVVQSAKYGIGKGATMDLESMEVAQLIELHAEITKAINNQLTTEPEGAK